MVLGEERGCNPVILGGGEHPTRESGLLTPATPLVGGATLWGLVSCPGTQETREPLAVLCGAVTLSFLPCGLSLHQAPQFGDGNGW